MYVSDDYLSEQNATPKKQQNCDTPSSQLRSSTPTKPDIKNLDFSTNLSPIHPRASTPTSRNAMDLYAIIHESKKKIMKLRERNNSPTLTEKITRLQQSPSTPNIVTTPERHRVVNSRANIPINENVLKMNQNLRNSALEQQSLRPLPTTNERYKDTQAKVSENVFPERISRAAPGSGSSTPESVFAERIARAAPGSGSSTPERHFPDRISRTAPGSGSSTPERNIRIIPEVPKWPKAIPASHVPNLRSSPSPTYDYLNLSPSGHHPKARTHSSQADPRHFPSYPDYRSLPRMGRSSPQNYSPQNLPQSPAKPNVFAPRESSSVDRRQSSPQHSSFASDRYGKTQPTSRNDFKQLLLRANWGTAPPSGSAVERLKNKMSPVKNKSWKSDILSSTIPEDCGEDDEQSDRKTPERNCGGYTEDIPRSSALVSQQCKAFDRNRVSSDRDVSSAISRVSPTNIRVSPTLETAL